MRFPRRALERPGAGLLRVLRRDDLERDLELREDRAPLRRGRRQEERRGGWRTQGCTGSVEPAPALRLRATQISSHGHLRAHSAVTYA